MSYVIHARKLGATLTYKAETPTAALQKVRALRAVGIRAQVVDEDGEEVHETDLEDLVDDQEARRTDSLTHNSNHFRAGKYSAGG